MKTKLLFGDVGAVAEELLFDAQIVLDTQKKCRILRLYPTTPDIGYSEEFSKELHELCAGDRNIKWCYASVYLEGMRLSGSLLAIVREE